MGLIWLKVLSGYAYNVQHLVWKKKFFWKVREVWVGVGSLRVWCGCFADLYFLLIMIHKSGNVGEGGLVVLMAYITWTHDISETSEGAWAKWWCFACVLFLITFGVASDAHVALISTIKRWNSKHTKKAMIWQTDRTSWPYRWNFVCFDSVLSARMMKGCAPDHAQVWAAQRKRACENQVKKVTCLLGNGGRKIIWKPIFSKKVASQMW